MTSTTKNNNNDNSILDYIGKDLRDLCVEASIPNNTITALDSAPTPNGQAQHQQQVKMQQAGSFNVTTSAAAPNNTTTDGNVDIVNGGVTPQQHTSPTSTNLPTVVMSHSPAQGSILSPTSNSGSDQSNTFSPTPNPQQQGPPPPSQVQMQQQGAMPPLAPSPASPQQHQQPLVMTLPQLQHPLQFVSVATLSQIAASGTMVSTVTTFSQQQHAQPRPQPQPQQHHAPMYQQQQHQQPMHHTAHTQYSQPPFVHQQYPPQSQQYVQQHNHITGGSGMPPPPAYPGKPMTQGF